VDINFVGLSVELFWSHPFFGREKNLHRFGFFEEKKIPNKWTKRSIHFIVSSWRLSKASFVVLISLNSKNDPNLESIPQIFYSP
jgi:hypothetical protein